MSLTIVGAVKIAFPAECTNGRKFFTVHINVSGLFNILICKAHAAVDIIAERLQILRRLNQIRLFLGSLSFQGEATPVCLVCQLVHLDLTGFFLTIHAQQGVACAQQSSKILFQLALLQFLTIAVTFFVNLLAVWNIILPDYNVRQIFL